MAAAKWDALTVDLQHGTADYHDLLTLLPIIEASGASPMVRVPWLDEAIIMRELDAGAMGVIAPMIETADCGFRRNPARYSNLKLATVPT
jgi:4-hydroxy-2-oxoheptanedioate aldolase